LSALKIPKAIAIVEPKS